MRHSRFARALTPDAYTDSSEPRSRSVAPTHPSPSLGRNLRLARTLASGEIYASPEPRPWLSPPVPGLPMHDIHITDGTQPRRARFPPCCGRGWRLLCYLLPLLLRLSPFLYVRPNRGKMGDVESWYCRHDKVPPPHNIGQGKRPRKGWPRLQTRSGKGSTGPGVRSIASDMALHDQRERPRRDHHSEDRTPCCYAPNATLPLYTRSKK